MFIISITFSLIGMVYFYFAVLNTCRSDNLEEAIERFGLTVPASAFLLIGISLVIDNVLLIVISYIYFLFAISVGRALYELVVFRLFCNK